MAADFEPVCRVSACMDKLKIGDRVECLTGRNSDCGNYYITKCRLIFGTIIGRGKYFSTKRPWFMVRFDNFKTSPSRVPAEKVKPLNLLDRLAEIPC